MGGELASRGVFWFEEPFPPEEIDLYTSLRPRIDVPLAAGENDFGVQGFREMIRAGALDIVQPDACRAGGITECVRIAKLAQEAGLTVGTHTWSDAVALVANAHFVASIRNGLTVEVDQTGNPFIDELLAESLTIEDGRIVHRVNELHGTPPTVCALHEEILDRADGDLRFVPDAVVAEEAVRTGEAPIAFFLPPTKVERIRTVIDHERRLPQKSTYFWPKPRTGCVIRPLD